MIFVTSDNGKLSFAETTRKSKLAYCEKYGYKFHSETFGVDVNPYWEQVRVMIEGLASCEEGEWINYTGADACILPNAPACEYLIDENFDLIISTDINGLNNNGFFLKNSEWGRDFLQRVWALKSDKKILIEDNGDGLVVGNHEWYEQAAFVIVLREIGLDCVKFVPKKEINSYPWDSEQGNFIVHLPGKSNTQRADYFNSLFNKGRTLTEEQLRRLAWLTRKEKTGLDQSEKIHLAKLRSYAGL